MEITWLGRSCFFIKGKGKTILTDPCHPDFGYPISKPHADIVTVSHFHPGHSYIDGVANSPKQIKGPGEYEIGKVFVTGITSFHDNEKGKGKGKNTIYVMEIDGINLCHLGDLGHPLTPQLLDDMGSIDVLFLPVGEMSTIPIDVAVEIVKQLNPSIVIPMHYKTQVRDNLQPVDEFLRRMGIHETETKPKLSLTRSSLPSSTQIVVLNYTNL